MCFQLRILVRRLQDVRLRSCGFAVVAVRSQRAVSVPGQRGRTPVRALQGEHAQSRVRLRRLSGLLQSGADGRR